MNQVVAIKHPQLISVNQSAELAVMMPAGISRMMVRGFFASISLSAQRLKAIALLRAKIMQSSTLIPRLKVNASGFSCIARKKPIIANGSANTVCENFTRER